MSHEDAVFEARISLPRPGEGAALAYREPIECTRLPRARIDNRDLGDARVRRIVERELAPLPSPCEGTFGHTPGSHDNNNWCSHGGRGITGIQKGALARPHYPRHRHADATANARRQDEKAHVAWQSLNQ
jgi:hypothetical protein